MFISTEFGEGQKFERLIMRFSKCKLREPGLCSALEPANKFKPEILPLSSSEIIGCFLVSDDKIAKCLYLSREFLVHSQRRILRKAHRSLVSYFKTNHGPLKLISHEHYGNLSARWAAFRRETPLQVEDISAFELYRKGQYRV
ncbi:uncharacterized protein LOC120289480 [Eucalyptus grandis]|uniref:uncharacterized protein LOC120289480 n=1 Tax=Eucalyptus grandis TaxID=71139 RepID=UPI00192EC0B4|nr:uncharacterized protein LOC120289480 [Eucalyptus grandis]XP_039160346.1 uncharacterized protein LOC120289480 [Eucalyptus grandis]